MGSLEYIRMEIWPDDDVDTRSEGAVCAVSTVDGERRLTELSEQEGLRAIDMDWGWEDNVRVVE